MNLDLDSQSIDKVIDEDSLEPTSFLHTKVFNSLIRERRQLVKNNKYTRASREASKPTTYEKTVTGGYTLRGKKTRIKKKKPDRRINPLDGKASHNKVYRPQSKTVKKVGKYGTPTKVSFTYLTPIQKRLEKRNINLLTQGIQIKDKGLVKNAVNSLIKITGNPMSFYSEQFGCDIETIINGSENSIYLTDNKKDYVVRITGQNIPFLSYLPKEGDVITSIEEILKSYSDVLNFKVNNIKPVQQIHSKIFKNYNDLENRRSSLGRAGFYYYSGEWGLSFDDIKNQVVKFSITYEGGKKCSISLLHHTKYQKFFEPVYNFFEIKMVDVPKRISDEITKLPHQFIEEKKN